jgi:hypothetical protein
MGPENGPNESDRNFKAPEVIKQEEIFFQGLESKVTIPEKTLVHPYEGIHLRIEPDEEQLPYFNPEAKISKSLASFLVAMATARSVFSDPSREDYYLYSQWVNLHCLPRFGGQNYLQFEVIGRNARGETWAQPVDYPKSESFDPPTYVVLDEMLMIKDELPKDLQEVTSEAQSVTLFDKEESEQQIQPNEKTIMQFQNFEIIAPRENPHVKEGGLHLWINAHLDKNAEGVQSDVKNGVEQFILSSAVAKSIYQELGIPIEIHFSGNWGLVPKNEPGEHWQEHLSAHANLYGAPPGQENVELPPRPNYQNPDIPEVTRQKIKEALEKHLSNYLEEFVNFHLNSLEGLTNATQN